MQSPNCQPHLHPVACLLQRWSFLRRTKLEPRRIALLAQIVTSHPALRRWLLIVASEPPRLRRALLDRAARELSVQAGPSEATAALEQLACEPVLHAVTEVLFRQSGLAPLARSQRTGRSARVRLSELSAHLQARHPLPA